MTEELKDFPFCGQQPSHDKMMDEDMWSHDTVPWRRVWCHSCQIGTDYVCEGYEPSEIEAWNRRAPDARDARIAELEAARIAYAREFPVNADGDPDVGSIHANIRALKAELAAAKAPAPIPSNSGELDPSTPWYPDDSGEWVEVPEDLMEMPAALSFETKIEGLQLRERLSQDHITPATKAGNWYWKYDSDHMWRIVAYKVVKP